jgi:hypothetical protein
MRRPRNTNTLKIAEIGDMIAIPGFIALVVYFSILDNHSVYEILLLIFSSGALVADIYFTYLVLRSNNTIYNEGGV